MRHSCAGTPWKWCNPGFIRVSHTKDRFPGVWSGLRSQTMAMSVGAAEDAARCIRMSRNWPKNVAMRWDGMGWDEMRRSKRQGLWIWVSSGCSSSSSRRRRVRVVEVVQVAGWRRGSSRSSNGSGRDSACAADAAAHEPCGDGHAHATGRGNVSQKSSRCRGFAAPLLRTRSNKWCIIMAPSCAFSSCRCPILIPMWPWVLARYGKLHLEFIKWQFFQLLNWRLKQSRKEIGLHSSKRERERELFTS